MAHTVGCTEHLKNKKNPTSQTTLKLKNMPMKYRYQSVQRELMSDTFGVGNET